MKAFTASLLSLIILAAAMPSQLTARAPGDVLICTGEHYTGDCETISVPFNQTLDAKYFHNAASFKPEHDAFCRITYAADTCTLHGDAFNWPDTSVPTFHSFQDPETGELVDAGSKITSFFCQECTACVE